MSTITVVNIRCDSCGADKGFQTGHDTRLAARAEVAKLGWIRRLDPLSGLKVDICENCHKLHLKPFIRMDGTARATLVGATVLLPPEPEYTLEPGFKKQVVEKLVFEADTTPFTGKGEVVIGMIVGDHVQIFDPPERMTDTDEREERYWAGPGCEEDDHG